MTQGQKSVTHLRPVWRSVSCFHYEWLLSDGAFHCTNPLDFQTSDQDAAIRHRIYGPGYDILDIDDLDDDDDFDDDDEEDQGVIYFEWKYVIPSSFIRRSRKFYSYHDLNSIPPTNKIVLQ